MITCLNILIVNMAGALMGKVDGMQFTPTGIARWIKTKRKKSKGNARNQKQWDMKPLSGCGKNNEPVIPKDRLVETYQTTFFLNKKEC